MTRKGTKASWEMAKKGTKQINKATRKQIEEQKSGKVMRTLGGTIKAGMDGFLGESLNSRSLRDALGEFGEVGDNTAVCQVFDTVGVMSGRERSMSKL
jgi:hypothetical protein